MLDISRPQGEFITSPHPFPAIIGGFGSGKSQAGSYRLLKLLMPEAGLRVSHFFPSYKLAKRRGLVGYVKDLERMGIDYRLNKSDMTIYVPQVDGTIFLETYHEPDAIVSFEVAHAVVDELDTLELEKAEYVWKKITERVRQTCNGINTLGCVTTPDQGKAGFCFKKWGSEDALKNGYHYIRASTRSNPFLPPGYADQITQNYDKVAVEAFVEGSWVAWNQTGLIYRDYGPANYTDTVIAVHEQLLWFHDFNYTPLSSGIAVRRGNSLFLLDEIILTSAVARQSALEFVEKFKTHQNKNVLIYGDPAGRAGEKHGHQSDYTEIESVLRAHGWKFERRVKMSTRSIKDGQNAVRAKILNAKGESSLFVNPQRAKWIHDGFTRCRLKDGSTFLEDDSDDHQHIMSAVRYMVDYEFPVLGGGGGVRRN